MEIDKAKSEKYVEVLEKMRDDIEERLNERRQQLSDIKNNQDCSSSDVVIPDDQDVQTLYILLHRSLELGYELYQLLIAGKLDTQGILVGMMATEWKESKTKLNKFLQTYCKVEVFAHYYL